MCPVCCLDVRLGLSAESKPLLLLLAENKEPKLVVFLCNYKYIFLYWGTLWHFLGLELCFYSLDLYICLDLIDFTKKRYILSRKTNKKNCFLEIGA